MWKYTRIILYKKLAKLEEPQHYYSCVIEMDVADSKYISACEKNKFKIFINKKIIKKWKIKQTSKHFKGNFRLELIFHIKAWDFSSKEISLTTSNPILLYSYCSSSIFIIINGLNVEMGIVLFVDIWNNSRHWNVKYIAINTTYTTDK